MAAKKRIPNMPKPPKGASVLEVERPEGAFELEVGEEDTGILVGPARESRQFQGRRSRIIKTDAGSFFLNGTAKLEQLGVMDLPGGTRIWIARGADVPIKGQASPMKDYMVAVLNGKADEDDLPF